MCVIGLDEVGRGCFAGPLTVAAVRLNSELGGLADSKRLSATARSKLEKHIRAHAADVSIAWCSAQTIDEIGLAAALRRCFKFAFSQISKLSDDRVVVDGTVNYLAGETETTLIEAVAKADDFEPAVMAASIIAKQARDRYMAKLAYAHPGYGFERHVGYGTAAHRQAIEQKGITPQHRISLKPLQHYASNPRSLSRS